MPYYFFLWHAEIIEHLAEHGVTPEEFESVVGDPESEGVSESTGRPLAFWAGRWPRAGLRLRANRRRHDPAGHGVRGVRCRR
jgi:hypothetical protein